MPVSRDRRLPTTRPPANRVAAMKTLRLYTAICHSHYNLHSLPLTSSAYSLLRQFVTYRECEYASRALFCVSARRQQVLPLQCHTAAPLQVSSCAIHCQENRSLIAKTKRFLNVCLRHRRRRYVSMMGYSLHKTVKIISYLATVNCK